MPPRARVKDLKELANVLRDMQSDDNGKGSRTEAKRRVANMDAHVEASIQMIRGHFGEDQAIESLTRLQWYELTKEQPQLLRPAIDLQKVLRQKIPMGGGDQAIKFWRGCIAYRQKFDDGSKLAKLRESAQKISMREHQTAAAKADFLEHGANSKLYKEQKNKNRPSLERLSRGSRGSRDSD